MHNEYELLDSGDGLKLERFGAVVLIRPCAQATWARRERGGWESATASYERGTGWSACSNAEIPGSWTATIDDLTLRLTLTPAGHLGVFPETRALWARITEALREHEPRSLNVLNLFAYSGGATLAAARTGCSVCHVDASRSMVTRARENAALNGLASAPIRWIVDDVTTFLDREIRRERRYDAIMLDPPSFGRGAKGEQYRFDRDLPGTLQRCRRTLTDEPAFVLLTAHTQGVTAEQLGGMMRSEFGPGEVETGTMQLTGAPDVRPIDDGVWVCWSPGK